MEAKETPSGSDAGSGNCQSISENKSYLILTSDKSVIGNSEMRFKHYRIMDGRMTEYGWRYKKLQYQQIALPQSIYCFAIPKRFKINI